MMHRDRFPINAICQTLGKTRRLRWQTNKQKYIQLVCCVRLSHDCFAAVFYTLVGFCYSVAVKRHLLPVRRNTTLADSWKREWIQMRSIHRLGTHSLEFTAQSFQPHGRRLSKIWNIVYCERVNGNQRGIKWNEGACSLLFRLESY
jgi:hypothetical protein